MDDLNHQKLRVGAGSGGNQWGSLSEVLSKENVFCFVFVLFFKIILVTMSGLRQRK